MSSSEMTLQKPRTRWEKSLFLCVCYLWSANMMNSDGSKHKLAENRAPPLVSERQRQRSAISLLFLWPFIFSGGSDGKESPCNAGESSSIPGSGRSPGEGNGNPCQYSCLENPMCGRAWWATVHRVAKSQRVTFTEMSSLAIWAWNPWKTFISEIKCQVSHMIKGNLSPFW